VINVLAEFKYGITRWLLLHTNLFVAWLFNTIVSLALVGGSSALVVGWAPAAVSSGVPEVMAYLNGILLPKVRLRPFPCKHSAARAMERDDSTLSWCRGMCQLCQGVWCSVLLNLATVQLTMPLLLHLSTASPAPALPS
jgi:hypothetical protein